MYTNDSWKAEDSLYSHSHANKSSACIKSVVVCDNIIDVSVMALIAECRFLTEPPGYYFRNKKHRHSLTQRTHMFESPSILNYCANVCLLYSCLSNQDSQLVFVYYAIYTSMESRNRTRGCV